MELLKTFNTWFLIPFGGDSVLEVKFAMVEPDRFILAVGSDSHEYKFKITADGALELYKKKIFARIERLNQKTLRYIEYKDSKVCFSGLLV